MCDFVILFTRQSSFLYLIHCFDSNRSEVHPWRCSCWSSSPEERSSPSDHQPQLLCGDEEPWDQPADDKGEVSICVRRRLPVLWGFFPARSLLLPSEVPSLHSGALPRRSLHPAVWRSREHPVHVATQSLFSALWRLTHVDQSLSVKTLHRHEPSDLLTVTSPRLLMH